MADPTEADSAGSSLYFSIGCAAILVALSGLFSGLNLGLMSFTDDDLGLVISGSGDPEEVECAQKIRPLRKRGNLLLCTLLLGNTLVNAVIAVLLADLTSGLVGTCVTTGLIVVFGEIVPQSICSRHALAVGALAMPLVEFFVLICYPIAYPISLILDRVLGREVSAIFSRQGAPHEARGERARQSSHAIGTAERLSMLCFLPAYFLRAPRFDLTLSPSLPCGRRPHRPCQAQRRELGSLQGERRHRAGALTR